MGFSVSSSFISRTRSKSPEVARKFTVGGVDYSNKVIKWPSFSRSWDDVRPKALQLRLANEDQALNVFRNDKTLMEGDCFVEMGVSVNEWSLQKYIGSGNYTSLDDGSGSTTSKTLFFRPDGLTLFSSDSNTDTINEYSLTEAWNITTISGIANSFSVTSQATNITGLFFKPDGSVMFVLDATTDTIYEYDLGTAWGITTAVYNSISFAVGSEDTAPKSLFFKPDGAKFWVSGGTNDTVYEYDLSTAWGLSTTTYNSNSFSVASETTTPAAAFFKPDGLVLYVLSSGDVKIYEYDLSTAWDITAVTHNGVSVQLTAATPNSMFFKPDGTELFVLGIVESRLDEFILDSEFIKLFAGKIRGIKYSKEDCALTIVDKFQQLSERQVGTSDVPITYTGSNYLPSDVAWWTVTSYGGYSNVQSTSNPDIDFADFQEWASVFSGDSVFVNANFDGQKCTEILRKIARQTHSAIFIKEEKISFHRFGLIDPTVTSLGPSEILNLELSFDTNNIINRQFVSGDFSVASNTHQFTVLDQSTSSVNSFGPKDNTLKDNSFWYIDSGSAINLAERKILADSEPDDSLKVTTGLAGLSAIIGETVFIADAFHNISESYRILSHTIDTDKGRVTLIGDRTQLSSGFILDTTSLDITTGVLT